jgi:hypothetical protein
VTWFTWSPNWLHVQHHVVQVHYTTNTMAPNGHLTYTVPITSDVVWRSHSTFHILSSQDHCTVCFTCLLHQWCCGSTCATQPNTNKLHVLLVAVTTAIGDEGDPSCWEGLNSLLTSRPSLRHLVSWVLVLIHDRVVYLQLWEAS